MVTGNEYNAPSEATKVALQKEAAKLKLDFNELKSGGFIKQVQKNLFVVRLRCPGGSLTPEKLRKAAEIAEKYGTGEVHLSIRQSLEIIGVHHNNFSSVVKELKEVGWSVASCGPRIRVPNACGGCTWNPNGLMDTIKLCNEIDRNYFGVPTGHHKFKINISGCAIDCPDSRDADLGFQGILEPVLVPDLCNACTLCVKACEEQALVMEGDLPVRDDSKCIYCGDCVKVCPMDAMVRGKSGWLVRVGGKHGKHPIYGYEVAKFISDEQALSLVPKTLEWYRGIAVGRERIGTTLNKHGLQKYIEEVVKPLSLEAIETNEERKKYFSEGNIYK
ncbi:MAG: 4Fe-4S binding protein [Dehalococcoidia bacterium]|nr:4Fe-4S binding protein [Dehalococcoidia bacterium]